MWSHKTFCLMTHAAAPFLGVLILLIYLPTYCFLELEFNSRDLGMVGEPWTSELDPLVLV